MADCTMAGDMEPGHSFLLAAKYDFLSQHIKTGSMLLFNVSKTENDFTKNENCESNACTTTIKTHKVSSFTGHKPYVCDTCHKGFTAKRTLDKHQRVHTDDKSYLCNFCHKSVTTKGHKVTVL